MSLRDDILDERAKEAKTMPPTYTDEEVYQQIISCRHRAVVLSIRGYFKNNPDASTWSSRYSIIGIGTGIAREEIPKYRKDSTFYALSRDLYDHDHVFLRSPTYTFTHKGWWGRNKVIALTPLGERVLKDLTDLAARDGITARPELTYAVSTIDMGTNRKKVFCVHPQPGVPFAGPDVKEYSRSSRLSINAEIVYEFHL